MAGTDFSLLGRLGAYTLHARYPAKDTTAAARKAFLARFEREVDPDGVLAPEDRAARAAAARKAYMLRLVMRRQELREERRRSAGDGHSRGGRGTSRPPRA